MPPVSTASSLPASTNGASLVLANGRPAHVVAFETGVVDFFVEAAGVMSVPKSVAAIYGLLFASPRPLSFAEIEARLDLSKGSVSQGLRALREVGAIKEVSSAADRAELFTPDTEMRKLIAHFLETRVEQQLGEAKARFGSMNGALGAYANGEQRILKQRLQKLQRWHDRTRALLPLIRTFLKLGS